MAEQAPVFILIAPLAAVVIITLLGLRNDRICLPVTLMALGGSLLASITTLGLVVAEGEVSYFLGGWSSPRGIGIEYRIDQINGLVLVMISAVALITTFYSKERLELETPGKTPHFYALYLLAVIGLLGMTITGDAFNLYVLLEVASLTAYALVAMGQSRRAAVSAFNYLIMGTIGASFYLLGVGYLYLKTGSLNMADIQQVITTQGLASSKTIQVAFILILVGVWIKMAFFPLSGWLPNVYSYAPSTTACLLAPLVTKVSIYVMIRMMLTVFGPEFVFNSRDGSEVIVWLAVVAIISASVLALRQTELKRMLSYLILAEVGYMVGGAWLANHYGMVGAIYHILSDGFMTLALFLASGIFFHATGSHSIAALKGIHEKMPWTMAAFTVAALSMIGVPPTCGFFSKFYLIRGGIESGHWEYVVALLFSSLINAILFFRIIESAYFNILPAGEANEEDPHSLIEPEFEKAPGSMLIPLIITAGLLLAIGLFNQDIVDLIQDGLQPYAIVGGRN